MLLRTMTLNRSSAALNARRALRSLLPKLKFRPSHRLFTRAKHFTRSSAALHATLSLYPQLCCFTRPKGLTRAARLFTRAKHFTRSSAALLNRAKALSHILFLTDHDAIFGKVQNISFGASRKKLTDCLATSEAVISVCATLT